MAVGDGWESQLITGLAELLHANGVGVWRADGSAYLAGEVAITDRAIPSSPDRLIAIATYPVESGPSDLADTTIGVQLRLRGTTDPRVCSDIGSALYDLLDSCGRQTWGSVSIVDVYRQSAVSLGQDQNDRWEASHNYYVAAMRPTVNRSN